MFIVFELTEAGTAQERLEPITTLTTSPLLKVEEEKVLLVAPPMLEPFTCH
jgi:hypothetical protein